jgi:hypothetical protein
MLKFFIQKDFQAIWEHIALTGDYIWNGSNPSIDFRPLRDVHTAAQSIRSARAGRRRPFWSA